MKELEKINRVLDSNEMHFLLTSILLEDVGIFEGVEEMKTLFKKAFEQPELCKYGQEPKSCTSSPMDCQCALDATFAQPEQNTVEAVKTVLKGIDKTEIESPDGWWETSAGAEFGAKKLKYVIWLLAQPEQEPVAWGNLANWCLDSDRVLITDKDEAAKYHRNVYDLTPLYTTPPQRTWVGLPDDIKEAVLEWNSKTNIINYVEEWLKEKNA